MSFDKCKVLSTGLSWKQKYENNEPTKSKDGLWKKFWWGEPPFSSLFLYPEIQFNPLEKTQVCRLGIIEKGRYEFFSSVKLIDVFWLLTNTCENNTYSIWEGRKARRMGELYKIPRTKRFIALWCFFSRLQYGLRMFCKVWWSKGCSKKKFV